ncbi:hypothetical protein PAEAM_28280 [Paenibacillus sp. GM1FR]|nr:hypothetical protein PAEAM_28280 [Paenibacillus sp. GM1FR]
MIRSISNRSLMFMLKPQSKKLIDIEMQLFNKYDIEKRTLFYWSKRYSSQFHEGEKYQELKNASQLIS